MPPLAPLASAVPTFSGLSRRPARALLATALIAGAGLASGCAGNRQAIAPPNAGGDQVVINTGNTGPWKARRALAREGCPPDKINAIMSLPYQQFSAYFPEQFSEGRGHAVSWQQSAVPALLRPEFSAADIYELGRMLQNPSDYHPETLVQGRPQPMDLPTLVLKHAPREQAGQIMGTLMDLSRYGTRQLNPYNTRGAAEPAAYALKMRLYMGQMRNEEEMGAEYRRFGLSQAQVSSLQSLGNIMSEREVVFGMYTTGGLRRFWEKFGPYDMPELARLSEAHWQGLVDLARNARPAAGSINDADHKLAKLLEDGVKAGSLSDWSRLPVDTFKQRVAAKVGYQYDAPPAGPRLMPPQPADDLPPPAAEPPARPPRFARPDLMTSIKR